MADKIAAEWRSYRANVVPSSASAVQVEETRRAFYAGVAAMYGIVGKIAVEDDAAGVRTLDGISDELARFKRDVLRGHA